MVTVNLPEGWVVVKVHESGRVVYATVDEFPDDLPAQVIAERYLAPAMTVVRDCIAKGRQYAPDSEPE